MLELLQFEKLELHDTAENPRAKRLRIRVDHFASVGTVFGITLAGVLSPRLAKNSHTFFLMAATS